ncbi:hypothetical protein C8J56DRAFT_64775 [Mycena floridula]|nr:hypothetical protein C8J56DRAFT_64775 [Mycena floridula]
MQAVPSFQRLLKRLCRFHESRWLTPLIFQLLLRNHCGRRVGRSITAKTSLASRYHKYTKRRVPKPLMPFSLIPPTLNRTLLVVLWLSFLLSFTTFILSLVLDFGIRSFFIFPFAAFATTTHHAFIIGTAERKQDAELPSVVVSPANDIEARPRPPRAARPESSRPVRPTSSRPVASPPAEASASPPAATRPPRPASSRPAKPTSSSPGEPAASRPMEALASPPVSSRPARPTSSRPPRPASHPERSVSSRPARPESSRPASHPASGPNEQTLSPPNRTASRPSARSNRQSARAEPTFPSRKPTSKTWCIITGYSLLLLWIAGLVCFEFLNNGISTQLDSGHKAGIIAEAVFAVGSGVMVGIISLMCHLERRDENQRRQAVIQRHRSRASRRNRPVVQP